MQEKERKVLRIERKVYFSGMNEPTNNGFNAEQQKHQDKRVALHVAILKDLAAQLPLETYIEVSDKLHQLGDACYWLGVATQLRHTKTV